MQTRLQRRVALKVLDAKYAADPSFLERFHREARLAARLDHPHIVRVYDVGQSAQTPYIAMEYVEGRSLDRVVAEEGGFPSRGRWRSCGRRLRRWPPRTGPRSSIAT